MNETNFAQFLIEHLVSWAAYLVLALVGALYAITRAELAALKLALSKTINKVDFAEYKVAQASAREERREAEKSIREQVTNLDEKMDRKFDQVIDNMFKAAQSPHNRRAGDE